MGHEDGVNIDILRKPLAYCLGRWAGKELARIKEGDGLSKPIRTVLKQAKAFQQWGGGFDTTMRAVCGKRFEHLIGTIQLRTVAGSAYLCCAAPTAADHALLQRVHKVSKTLTLASSLNPESAEVAAAMDRLPQWYRAIDRTGPGWVSRVVETTGDGAGRGRVLGNLLGDVLGDVLGDLLSG